MILADAVAEVLDHLGYRHPAKPPHEQWMHAGKAKAVAKTAEKLLAALGAEPPAPAKATKKAAKKATKKATPKTGDAALAVPPLDLAKMGDDPRAPALWYRTGDNSMETRSGMPGFVPLNEHMRDGGYDAEMDARVADIRSAMRESVLTEPIEVLRGIGSARRFGEPGELKGVEFTDKAFVSTTTNAEHASNFGAALMRIRVPAGVSAIRMADRDPNLIESEILLDSDLGYRITGEQIERDDRGRIRKHILDVEVIP